MRYVALGRELELKIPVICLGSNNFGAQVSPEVSFEILDTAFELGVNMVDSANVYTKGKSEEIIGKWAKDRRNDVIIATKVGMEPPSSENRSGLSRENILFQLEASLKRLETDYIDLYYVHQFDERTPLLETLETLDNLKNRENKIRHVACSNFSAKQLKEALDISEQRGLEKFIANQVEYSVLQREIESETLPFCSEKSVGVLAYSPLRSGMLAGRYERSSPPPPGSRGSYRGPEYLKRLTTEENFEKLQKLKEVAKESDLSLPVLAISWILHHGGVSSAVVGASNPGQFREASKAASVKLPERTFELVNGI